VDRARQQAIGTGPLRKRVARIGKEGPQRVAASREGKQRRAGRKRSDPKAHGPD